MSNVLKFCGAVAAFLSLGQVSSYAQATRTWVSTVVNFSQEGIRDERNAGGALFINNTTVQDNAGAGITHQPASGSLLF